MKKKTAKKTKVSASKKILKAPSARFGDPTFTLSSIDETTLNIALSSRYYTACEKQLAAELLKYVNKSITAPAESPVKSRKQEGRELLEKIVSYINERGVEAKHMWHVLTALRGPDTDALSTPLGFKYDEISDMKKETTSRLRNALGFTNTFFIIQGGRISNKNMDDASRLGGYHFSVHLDEGINGSKYFGYEDIREGTNDQGK